SSDLRQRCPATREAAHRRLGPRHAAGPGPPQRTRRLTRHAMAVYVDDAVTLWRGRRWAHLMADTLEELHAFAAALGMPRHAFQDRTSGAHYDVTAQLRERAIALGAVPVSRHRDRDLMLAVIANALRQGRRHMHPRDGDHSTTPGP